MGIEIDLLKNYPKAKRNTSERANVITEADREIAREYGEAFFDGDRTHGYGGFHYAPRFWQPVIPDFIEHFSLSGNEKILDIGCAKGFMLYDLKQALPQTHLVGLDISEYAISKAKEEVKPYLQIGDAKALPFKDNEFDVVFSINTVHNLEREECINAIKEIERVSKGKAFITVDAYRNEEEKKRMFQWALTAKTILHVDEWVALFEEAGYSGDYYWFIP
ncbi:class I SAM-dependent methyltransferase [Thalassotalea marina]|uniref:Methyltransferase n=1 Tax=Thalassotalea marina TaxID=1673741 RepID=A0A919BBX9_9GAMM|nr:class I SAM-dependent methyltransferase [Thalassotalea marina]GHF80447.1 methyltransferase [Thalassotalea marina]